MSKRMIDRSSMLIWWPKVKHLDIMMPKTVWILVDPKIAYNWVDGKGKYKMKSILNCAQSIDYPLFVRTDLVSGKHEWKNTCYVDNMYDLPKHIYSLVEYSLMCDLMGKDINAFFFREYIEMDSKYKAFNEMPVNSERRYFIKDGKILCHHSYWIEDAIRRPSVENWRELSREMNNETEVETRILSDMVEEIKKPFGNEFWSIDFCKGANGFWYFIDMARGEDSWHSEDCAYILKGDKK